MNPKYVYQSAQVGEFRNAVLTATGPASYSSSTGDPVANAATAEYINSPNDTLSQSGNYNVSFYPKNAANLRAGASSASQSGWTALWTYSGKQGVIVVQNAAGIGMTPGLTVPIVFSGGTGGGAAGTVTVLTATTISINITSTGSYTSAPTATISGTGGTPATLTVTTAPASGVVANGTNLSAEVVLFNALVSQL